MLEISPGVITALSAEESQRQMHAYAPLRAPFAQQLGPFTQQGFAAAQQNMRPTAQALDVCDREDILRLLTLAYEMCSDPDAQQWLALSDIVFLDASEEDRAAALAAALLPPEQG